MAMREDATLTGAGWSSLAPIEGRVDDATLAGAAPQRRGEETITQGANIGRYLVLGKLGAGGMGVVYAAYDPELDRKVAIKLLHSAAGGGEQSEGRTRLMREAQALAKLSHPNVVAVYDVGTVDARVWMAMEFVTGRTLDAWLAERSRPWPEVLRIMTAAGEGLAAAHEAGLLHRDFKPENVMLDESGRVRVMDFGLARAGSNASIERSVPGMSERSGPVPLSQPVTQVGSLVGTPGYMSPEQFAGRELDARSDQFSFCVALWEALYGRRPFEADNIPELAAQVLEGKLARPPAGVRVPAWLRRVCERGLATDSLQRFMSMRRLLHALARGRACARRKAVLVGVGALAMVGVAALGIDRWQHARQVAACEAEGASIIEVWNDEARARVRAAILATGVNHAETTAGKVVPWIDREADAWHEHQTRACRHGTVEVLWDADTLERARWCLEERRVGIESLVRVLAAADRGVAQTAIKAASVLKPSAVCLDAAALAGAPLPPERELHPRIADARDELTHARTLSWAGKYDQGLALVAGIRDEVAELDWAPLSARASAVESSLLIGLGSFADAEDAGIAAYVAAAESSAWGDAADAAEVLVSLVGRMKARPAEGRLWAKHAEIAASFAGDPLGLHEAARVNNLAGIALSTGAYDEATALYERALELRRSAVGAEHPEVGRALANLGAVAWSRGAAEEARRSFEQALTNLEGTLGPEHPDIAVIVGNLGNLRFGEGDYSGAKASYERALAIETAALPPDHPSVAASVDNLALVHTKLGDLEQALVLHSRALALWEQAVGPQHPSMASSLCMLGDTHIAQARPSEALAAYERAVAIYELHDGIQPNEYEARFVLGKLLVETGGDRARALSQVQMARDGFGELGEGKVEALAAVDAWIAGLPAPVP
jgi:eukaryotic-like serine/threonine-protein kinase